MFLAKLFWGFYRLKTAIDAPVNRCYMKVMVEKDVGEDMELKDQKLNDQALWDRLVQLNFDEVDAKFPFSERLARETGWTHDYSLKAIHEYRKFLYLAMIYPPVTPSQEVDEVWHLHLKTEHYQKILCDKILQKDLLHIPEDGSQADKEKHRQQYIDTRIAYAENFGMPPEDVWGSADFNNAPTKKIDYGVYFGIIVGSAFVSFIINNTFVYLLITLLGFGFFIAYMVQIEDDKPHKKRRKKDDGCTTSFSAGCGSGSGDGGGGGGCGGGGGD
jgi:uncharacterized membrane protein YgcG